MKNLKLKSITLLIGCILSHFLSYSQDEVKIGQQIWTTKNLNVSKFRNGESIPEAKTESEWKAYGEAGEAAWCYFEFTKKNKKIYNWYAVNDTRGLAPIGYHIPKQVEWNQLVELLGGYAIAGIKMKCKEGWELNGNGTNSSGFSGLPNSSKYKMLCIYWTSDEKNFWELEEVNENNTNYVINKFPKAYFRALTFESKVISNEEEKSYGASVRCIKD